MPGRDSNRYLATRIITPSDFPVSWEEPGDHLLFWARDKVHFPGQMPPMTNEWIVALNEGCRRASESCMLIFRLRYSLINTYIYVTSVPMVPLEDMAARDEKAEEILAKNMSRLWIWWETELLPEIKDHLAYCDNYTLKNASMADLITHLQEIRERLIRLFQIHFQILFPLLIATSEFEELYKKLFGKQNGPGAFRLLQGFNNKTVEGNHALWQLSRKVLSSDRLASVLQEHEPEQVIGLLGQFREGRLFLQEFYAYLREFGQRCDVNNDLSHVTWFESPATPVRILQNLIKRPENDPLNEILSLARERGEIVASVRQRLKGYSKSDVNQFELLLKAAQAANVLSEDHNYWIEQQAAGRVRQVLLEFGHRLEEAGAIDNSDDIFFLDPEELDTAADSVLRRDLRELVNRRKSEMEHFSAVQPPGFLGTQPAEPIPDNVWTRLSDKFYGKASQEFKRSNIIEGSACSAGKIMGTARVIHSLDEADRLQPGDILVARSTMPSWTPLFASIAAVVTDAGGTLSHAAIVAREYRIPAVMGTGSATTVIKDGQIIEVDGDAGIVRIIEPLL